MTRLLLVRHGESTWNRARRLQGQCMTPELTDLGHEQARAAAQRIVELLGDWAAEAAEVRLISSDQTRALQTAQVIGDAVSAPVATDERLREQGLGELEGKSYDDLVPQEVPEGQHISEISWAGGETIQQVHARLRDFVADLAAQPEETVILVSHGDTLRVLLAVLDSRGHREVEWCPIGNAEVIERTLG